MSRAGLFRARATFDVARILLALVMVLAAALGWSLYRAEVHKGAAEDSQRVAQHATNELNDTRRALEKEREANERMSEIDASQASQRERIESEVETRAADLLAGNLRLRREIAALHTAHLSAGTAAAIESDAAAQRGAELVAAAVGVGAEADAVQRGLIEAYEVCRWGSQRDGITAID